MDYDVEKAFSAQADAFVDEIETKLEHDLFVEVDGRKYVAAEAVSIVAAAAGMTFATTNDPLQAGVKLSYLLGSLATKAKGVDLLSKFD